MFGPVDQVHFVKLLWTPTTPRPKTENPNPNCYGHPKNSKAIPISFIANKAPQHPKTVLISFTVTVFYGCVFHSIQEAVFSF